VIYGGEFPTVNGVAQQGLVRFALPTIAPNRIAPVITTALVPSVSSPSPGRVDVTWKATYDNDNANLTYKLVRDGATATPVYTKTQISNFYTLPQMSFTETGVAAGSHTYRLYVNDPFGNTISRLGNTVTVAGGGTANQAPVARVSASTAALTATVSGSASTDADGTIASYAWTFGDGATASGVSASHAYASAGTYTVTLTVRDNTGATGSASTPVTVTNTAPAALATDTFTRTVSGGWGSATTGGAWTIAGSATNLSVTGGRGAISIPAGSTRSATLGAVSTSSTDLSVTTSFDAIPTGTGVYATAIGRQAGSAMYTASVWLKSTGVVTVVVKQGSTVVGSATVSGLTYTAGSNLRLRFQATGTAPTTLRAKAWVTPGAEPSAWQVSATDSTVGLQSAGTVGLQAYLSGSATAASVIRFDDFSVQAAG
jgi:PKD repeat protein